MAKIVENIDLIRIHLDNAGNYYLSENVNFKDKNILFFGFCFGTNSTIDLTTGTILLEKPECKGIFLTLQNEKKTVVKNFAVQNLDVQMYSVQAPINRVLDLKNCYVSINNTFQNKILLMYVFYGKLTEHSSEWGVNFPINVPANYRGTLQQIVGDVRNFVTLKWISVEEGTNAFLTFRAKNKENCLEYLNTKIFQANIDDEIIVKNDWLLNFEDVNWDNSEVITDSNELKLNLYF
ncbi:MAG: hypothetical protein LBS50_08695 [Prevotellaceae bacterium]|nr:hypothetical protein [Prevotellaceae bacterium]